MSSSSRGGAGGVGPIITDQDAARFAMQRGALPGLENVGGGDVAAGGASPAPSGDNPATMGVPSTGPGTIESAINGLVDAANSTTGKNLGVGLQAASIIPGVGSIPASIATGINVIGGAARLLGFGGPQPETLPLVDPTLVSLNPNAAPTPDFSQHELQTAGQLGITDPSTQGFRDSSSRTGYRDISGKELTPPGAPPLPACFLEGTLIKTVDGYTAIDKIEPGVRVPTSKGVSTIYRVYKGFENEHYRVNGVAVTGYHPYARPDGTWTAAKDLKVGDEVSGFDGNLVIEKHEHVPTAAYVWNILVEPAHEFYVQGLNGDYLVHNGDGVRRDDPPPRAYGWTTLVNRGHEFLLDPRTHRSVELTGARLTRQKKSGLPLVQDPRGRSMKLDDSGGDEGSGESGGMGGGEGGTASGEGGGFAGNGPAAAEGNAFEPDEPPPPPDFAPAQVTTKFAGGGPVPTYYQRGGPAVLSASEARAQRVRAFEMQHGSRAI